MIFNPNQIIIEDFVKRLRAGYEETYSGWKPEYVGVIAWAASIAAQIHSNLGDTLYHNLIHIIDVTLVGQEILRGRHIIERVLPESWLHFLMACAFHDIGFVKRLLPEDKDRKYPRGATGASLSDIHVDRGKHYVMQRFSGHDFIDAIQVADYIEQTRFPFPKEERYNETNTMRGLVRAADFIGQLANLHLYQNQLGLFQEFEESGSNQKLGYKTVDDLRDGYPSFFFNVVRPYIKDGVEHLERTVLGRQIVTNLLANVFRAQHPELSTI